MRRSEFERAVADEFGARGGPVLNDLVLTSLGDLTASEAIHAGMPPKDIWLALCIEMDVAPERRYGAGRLEPRRR
ncbi:DUF3046 domain-containing protein [Microbacterium sp. NPDC076911]|uniref:DUF3046 domain-containing protein n=1 Tax=Microbacterium sp. NPDC076911 TaxID=3154958 RepID=UPI00342DBC93